MIDLIELAIAVAEFEEKRPARNFHFKNSK